MLGSGRGIEPEACDDEWAAATCWRSRRQATASVHFFDVLDLNGAISDESRSTQPRVPIDRAIRMSVARIGRRGTSILYVSVGQREAGRKHTRRRDQHVAKIASPMVRATAGLKAMGARAGTDRPPRHARTGDDEEEERSEDDSGMRAHSLIRD